ncbi:hypothetical protein [Pedobacter frigoris]|uniref:hypothetical protein n=1 Tax=Pedobacter frigoris TaxID=2571272 RepID=UPI00292D3A57|nr:hypothetical protein [Pedobacter frigoris]
MKTLKLTIALLLFCSMGALAQALPLGSNNYSGSASVNFETHNVSIDFYLTGGHPYPFAVGTSTFDGNPMTYLRYDSSLGLCYEIYVGTARYIVYLQVNYDSYSNEYYYPYSPSGPVMIEKQGW